MSTKTQNEQAPIALATRTASNSVIVRMAQRFQMDPIAFERTMMATCMPPGKQGEVTKEQFVAFLLVAEVHNLNPVTKEIYAFPSKNGGVVPIVSVDGWYKLMNSHPQFDGIEFVDTLNEQGALVSVEAKVYRKDRARPTCVTEYMVECKRGTEPWRVWERRMLRHKAAIQGARAAFGFAGIYDPDEGESIVEAQATVRVVETRAKKLEDLTTQLESQATKPADAAIVANDPAPVEEGTQS